MLWLRTRQLKSKQVDVRREAIAELAQSPGPRLYRALVKALRDSDAEVRRHAAVGLGKLGEDRCAAPLVQALRDSHPEVVKAAIIGLKHAPGEQITAALLPLLRHADAGVRGQAAVTFDFLGWRPEHVEDEIWYWVAKGQFGRAAGFGAAALPALEVAVGSGPSSISIGAVEALGQMGDARAVRPLVRALKSADPGVCVAAVNALSRMGDTHTLEALLGALTHPNAQVRVAAVEALGRLRSKAAVEQLCPLLADPVWEVRRETAEALGRIGDARAVEPLAGALGDGDADVRETTALALGNLGDRRAIRSLVLSLKDSTSGVRRIAAAALSRIDPRWSATPEAQAAVEELKTALQEGDSDVRHFVGQLLVNLGALSREDAPEADPEAALVSSPAKRRKLAVTLFAAILCDRDRDLRQAAAEALGGLKDPRAQAALLRAQTDADPGVSAAATRALESLAAG